MRAGKHTHTFWFVNGAFAGKVEAVDQGRAIGMYVFKARAATHSRLMSREVRQLKE